MPVDRSMSMHHDNANKFLIQLIPPLRSTYNMNSVDNNGDIYMKCLIEEQARFGLLQPIEDKVDSITRLTIDIDGGKYGVPYKASTLNP